MEDLFNQSVKLEAMEKKAGMADSEVSALRNKLILLQENAEKQEDKLAKSTLELAFACQTADSIVKRRHELENIVSSNEDKIDALEKQVRADKAPRLSARVFNLISPPVLVQPKVRLQCCLGEGRSVHKHGV